MLRITAHLDSIAATDAPLNFLFCVYFSFTMPSDYKSEGWQQER